MKITNDEVKGKLILRLKRLEGQVHGVQRMVEEERDCREIIQQISAVQSAMKSASRIFLQEYATTCLMEMGLKQVESRALEPIDRENLIKDLLSLLD
jgi:DNA-binding FrmR family transcriptional regulator